jgi:hypothetical protein
MVIESRTIVGAAAAFALVGAAVWGSSLLFQAPEETNVAGTVEVVQVQEPSWAVEIKELDANEAAATEVTRTAANR